MTDDLTIRLTAEQARLLLWLAEETFKRGNWRVEGRDGAVSYARTGKGAEQERAIDRLRAQVAAVSDKGGASA